MVEHRGLLIWEKKLKEVFDEIDDHLEDRYGDRFPLHPRRSKRNRTSNKEQDGLFNVGASFSMGLGSRYGPGYVVEVRFSTLARVPEDLKRRVEREVAGILRDRLPEIFPGRRLKVRRDGGRYKIYGDLSLGKLHSEG
jgi:hypothetical protein